MFYKTISINWNGDAATELEIMQEKLGDYSKRELVEIAINEMYQKFVNGELNLAKK